MSYSKLLRKKEENTLHNIKPTLPRIMKHALLLLLALAVLPLCAQQTTTGKEPHKIDTLLYYWHDPMPDDYPNLVPEDRYMELYLEDGILKGGYFWGTTDEFEDVREGYECGYFVLPLTGIQHERDSVSFRLSPTTPDDGKKTNCFVKAPIDLHIRSWQEALSRYQPWEYFNPYYFESEYPFSISATQGNKPDEHATAAPAFTFGDTIHVRNLSFGDDWYRRKSFVLQKRETSFQTFLSEFKKAKRMDAASFGKAFDFIDHAERYSKFLPATSEECRCEPENASWIKGSYIELKGIVVVMLQRYCSDYQDGNNQWFMENDGTDYVLITYSSYSSSGKMLDCKTVGHSGTAHSVSLSASEHGPGLVAEQRTLDDCSLLHQYKDLVYTVSTHEYTVKPDGTIEERTVDAPHKEVVDVMSSIKQLSFPQFQSYFQKQDNPSIDHTLFTPSETHEELPFESCLSLIPDTLDHNSFPRDIRWIPCRCIEGKTTLSFFLIKDCATPIAGFLPYTDYMILEFHKNGTFKSARNIYHTADDNPTLDPGTIASRLSEALKDFPRQ